MAAWLGATTIRAQRYDASGNPSGGQLTVNDASDFDGYRSVGLALGPLGDFVVSWNAADFSGYDVTATAVRGQRYDASGTPIGANFDVAGYSVDERSGAAITADDDGNYIVVWAEGPESLTNFEIFAKRSGLPSLPSLGAVGLLGLAALALVAGMRGLRSRGAQGSSVGALIASRGDHRAAALRSIVLA